jgi:hypothetical protein
MRRETADTTWIFDPVAGNGFVLQTTDRVVRKIPVEAAALGANIPEARTAPRTNRGQAANSPAKSPAIMALQQASNKVESLGMKKMEGVAAQGTRTATPIVEGRGDNEQPIQVFSERWYSPDLQVPLMLRTVDPRGSETAYRLTNIQRAEPDPALFQVPSGYTLQQ